METKFNFNSQTCTSRLQSEKLLALGLKKETADMYWVNLAIFDCEEDMWCLDFGELPYQERIPAWSLHRLLCLYNCHYLEFMGETEIASAYDIVIEAIESAITGGYFNEKYLE